MSYNYDESIQVRRPIQHGLTAGAALGKAKYKPKPKKAGQTGNRFVYQYGDTYVVRINRKGCLVNRSGFKDIVEAVKFRDAELANHVPHRPIYKPTAVPLPSTDEGLSHAGALVMQEIRRSSLGMVDVMKLTGSQAAAFLVSLKATDPHISTLLKWSRAFNIPLDQLTATFTL